MAEKKNIDAEIINVSKKLLVMLKQQLAAGKPSIDLVPLATLVARLDTLVAEYPSNIFLADHYYLVTLLTQQVTALRQDQAFRNSIIKGELGRHLDALIGIMRHAVYQHDIFQSENNVQANTVISEDSALLADADSDPQQLLDDISATLHKTEQQMLDAAQKAALASELASAKNDEVEKIVQELKADKFSANSDPKAKEEVKLRAAKLTNEMCAMNASAVLAADLSTTTCMYFREMLDNTQNIYGKN